MNCCESFGLSFSRRAEAAAVGVIELFNFNEFYLGLLLHYAELADAVVLIYDRIAQGVCRVAPLVVIAAVGFVDDGHAVGLDDAEVLVGAAAGREVRFVAFGQYHAHAEGYESEFAGLHFHGLGGAQVDPVALVYLGDLLDIIAEVFYLYCFHKLTPVKKAPENCVSGAEFIYRLRKDYQSC